MVNYLKLIYKNVMGLRRSLSPLTSILLVIFQSPCGTTWFSEFPRWIFFYRIFFKAVLHMTMVGLHMHVTFQKTDILLSMFIVSCILYPKNKSKKPFRWVWCSVNNMEIVVYKHQEF